MGKRTAALARALARPGRYGDGGTLFLAVAPRRVEELGVARHPRRAATFDYYRLAHPDEGLGEAGEGVEDGDQSGADRAPRARSRCRSSPVRIAGWR